MRKRDTVASKPVHWLTASLSVAFIVGACAGWDNPTALEDLQADVEFEIEAARVETLEEVQIHVHATEGGAPMTIHQPHLQIEHGGVEVALVEMERVGDEYEAHVTFFEEGDHHLHFMGVPNRHRLEWEIGEHELHVHNAHRIIGPYWVELEVSPAPVLENQGGHIHVLVFELLQDGTAGAAVGGLQLDLEVHDPAGVETALAVAEEGVGEYEAEFAFGAAGEYELHVGIDVGGVLEEGEFHIPVPSPAGEPQEPGDEGGGHGHG
jgi:hypothetical protein